MNKAIPYRYGQPVAYHDLYLRLIACIFAAHFVVAYGEDLSFFDMLEMPSYYYALVPSFVIAMILFAIIRSISIRLDRRFDWTGMTLHRAGMQAFFGLMIPAISAYLLALLYFTVRGVDISETTYGKFDFLVILLQLVLINFYYMVYYFHQKWQQAEKTISSLVLQQDGTMLAQKQTFTVSKGAEVILMQLDDIAYFYRNEDNNFLRTVKGEDYFVGIALDEVQAQLPEDRFFRANRQLIVHRQACKGFGLLTYGKLNVLVEPPYAHTIISQKRAGAFKKWLDHNIKPSS